MTPSYYFVLPSHYFEDLWRANYLHLCCPQIINHLRNGHKSQMEMKLLSLLTVKSDCDIWLRFKAKSGLSLNWFYSPSHCIGPTTRYHISWKGKVCPDGHKLGKEEMANSWRERAIHAQRPPSWSLTYIIPFSSVRAGTGGLSKWQVWEIRRVVERKQQLSPSIS